MQKSSQVHPHYALILFKDGAFSVETFGQKTFYKEHYQKEAKLFGVPQHLRIDNFAEWLSQGKPKHPMIVEYSFDD